MIPHKFFYLYQERNVYRNVNLNFYDVVKLEGDNAEDVADGQELTKIFDELRIR